MDLQMFITESLLEITNGLKQANEKIKDAYGPSDLPAAFQLKPGTNADLGRGIQFDIAVTTSLEGKGSAGAGIKLSVVQVGVGGSTTSSSEQISRIRFTVAVNHNVG